MLVSEIFDEVKEVTGDCDSTLNFRTITRAVELLANTKLIDPLIGYLEIAVTGSLWIALPRDVKTVLRINISSFPSFTRSQLFEFTQNTNGSVDGEEVGYSWANRGYLPIQDETKFPGKVAYLCAASGDAGGTVVIRGRDVDGNEITEELQAAVNAVEGALTFHAIDSVSRSATTGVCSLEIEGDTIARFYGDETRPQYRVIKLSKRASFVRILFRREVFRVTSLNDILPMDSAMAVIHAAKAVKLFKEENYTAGAAALELAGSVLAQDQAARDEADQLSGIIERPTATDQNIANRDGLIVGDIYDSASEIFGPIGREGVFDKIATAIELVSNMAQWDSMVGVVDIYREIRDDGIFVLPRYAEGIFACNVEGLPATPRSQWFQFNLNGMGEGSTSGVSRWDDMGESVITRPLPVSEESGMPVAQNVAYVPYNVADEGKHITLIGLDENGREVSEKIYASITPEASTKQFTRIERIERQATTYPCRLVTLTGSTASITIGDYYPDETEPKYKVIKIDRKTATRIRVFYRRRETLIRSMGQPIHLRSRLAMECAMRALKLMETDPAAATEQRESAAQLLREEMRSKNRSRSTGLQFDKTVMPGVTGNVQ